MRPRLALAIMLTAWCLVSCGSQPAPPAMVATTRALGTWQGRGSQTIGFNSESGRFRVTWQTRNDQPPGRGTFQLTAHSAVSGRPIQAIADHRGIGEGAANVEDDPRPYNLMVESANIDWTISVIEVVATPARH